MAQPKIKVIHSTGHSTRTISSFVSALVSNGIEILIDIRTYPTSRFQPQFSKNNLAKSLLSVGIFYDHLGRNLGGKLPNVDYDKTVREIAESVKDGAVICLCCSEKDENKCHRKSMLKPSFAKLGVEMVEIKYQNE